ncbi:MAG: glycoside hydrolase family 29 [Bacteroidetes bacterium]|nr:MAG: glycoside hydrolase family 29 [Bacteroidota bacterium]
MGCNRSLSVPEEIAPNRVVPTSQLVAYQQMELIGFIHFSINTFTGKEWGYGDESPSLFNPTELNVEQWVETAKAAGMKELILTAKHHDGFCLWPSEYTEHSIKYSPYKKGRGDVVDEFVRACRKHGLKAGLYLSPWDRNHEAYGREEYISYYKNQLRELLTQYGEISEIWFDGANGGDGYYGGAREVRRIDSKTYYPWAAINALVKELQPHIKIFSDAGPDVHWIGNEKGFAGFTFWSTIDGHRIVPGGSQQEYLNRGDPQGEDWIVGQCDVSIRPGWFYHAEEDGKVKRVAELVDIYYKSVGRNALLLLNLPPDRRGLIHENDVAALMSFREVLDETFAVNLAASARVEANDYRMHHSKFAPSNVLDGDLQTYWATNDSVLPAQLTIQFYEPLLFDRILLQEPITYGQRISQFKVEVASKEGWEPLFEGTTVGYKRLLRVDPVESDRIRITILEANNTVALANVGIYKSKRETYNGR